MNVVHWRRNGHAKTAQCDIVRTQTVPYETVQKLESCNKEKKYNKIARKKTYQTVRGNSRHFHSNVPLPPLFAGENAAKHALDSDVPMRAKIVCSNYTFLVPYFFSCCCPFIVCKSLICWNHQREHRKEPGTQCRRTSPNVAGNSHLRAPNRQEKSPQLLRPW